MSETSGTIQDGTSFQITNTGAPLAFYSQIVANPSRPAWRWSVAPGCYFNVANAPNRFHRFMQRVFLGLVWERN